MDEQELEEIKEKVKRSNKYILYVEVNDIKKLLKYVEKQQKEIEDLKKNKGYHLGFIDGEIAKRYEMEDKIKEKIKEIESLPLLDFADKEKFNFKYSIDGLYCMKKGVIFILKELLGELVMNEEEKYAIEDIKEMLELYEDDCLLTTDEDMEYIKVILNLVEKQQKEIEQLDKKFQYAIPVDVINELYINKDKIKEKIEEITSYAYTSAEERDCQDYAIQVLKEILGE